jgi:cytochrome c oxidase subunit 4
MLTQDTAQQQHGDHELVPYGVYLKVWAILMVLTVVTVGVSYLDLKHVTVLTATLIATVKGTLVLLYFMHVRFEERIYAWMIVAVLGTYAIFVGLTFVDYWYR